MASEDAVAGGALVSLTTDFGLRDGYVAAMKAVILSRAASAQIVDITHDVDPQDVLEGAFALETAFRHFPAGSVHVAVIDPGVGTARNRLAIASGGTYFIGPDNGCLSASVPDEARGPRAAGDGYRPRAAKLPPEVMAVTIENDSLLRGPVSATFEGRDVFAPVAAYLANGGVLAELGPRVQSLIAFPAFRAPSTGHGLDGRVLHVDRFGNLITDIHGADVRPGSILIAGGRRLALAHTYAESTGLAAITGSSGLVEIAMPHGSATQVLGLAAGDHVRVTWP
jgi:S-adenosylmethionine hydrolase